MAYQRQNWQVNESGILRKKDEPEEELLVFGYACKLFRDDEKALYVDQGKHLIPWMGNESLRIDRYDVRGAVYDLSQFETVGGHQEEPLWFNLSAEELRVEQMCDEERYRALTHNEDEEALYQEEELKRLHQALGSDKAYGQVSYKYDDNVDEKDENGESEEKSGESNSKEEFDEPFKPPIELDIPQGMLLPESVKLNAIIEKTAMFIDRQGSQMEIVLKIKQAGNPQFDFLSLNSPLHPYYRFLLSAIKTGRYRPVLPSASSTSETNDQDNNSQNSYYLHGSLTAPTTANVDVAPVIPTINYKPSADCAYSMLVNRIKCNQSKYLSETTVAKEESNSNSYDGVAVAVTGGAVLSAVTAKDDERVGQDLEDDSKGSMSPVSRPRPPKRRRRKRQQGACAYYDPVEQEMEYTVAEGPATEEETVMYCEPPPLSHEEVAAPVPVVVEVTAPVVDIPPADLQLIIDKMASYVAKNGRDFEAIVRSKGDPRFYFLDPTNQFYEYYLKQVDHYETLMKPVAVCEELSSSQEQPENVVESVVEENSCDSLKKESSDSSSEKKKSLIKPVPVCFSIKKPKESEGLEIKSALPVEESSGEEGKEEEEEDEGEEGVGGEVVEEKVVESVVGEVVVVIPPPEKKVEKVSVVVKDEKRLKKEKKLDVEREKQLERKRRAAAFLNLIHKHKENSNSEPVIGPQLPPAGLVASEGRKSEDESLVSTPPSSLSSPNNPPLPPLPTSQTDVPTIEIEDSPEEVPSPKVSKRKGGGSSSSHRPSIASAKAYMEYYKASESKRLHSEYEMLKRRRSKKKSDRKHSSRSSHSDQHLSRTTSSSSRRRRRSSREESHHHRKHKHRRRISEGGLVVAEDEQERRKRRKHKEKAYKTKKHKRKEVERSESSSEESSSSSSSSDSDSD